MCLLKVTLTGASGSLGSVVLDKLVRSGKFKVQILRRNNSASTFPPHIPVVEADFESIESLTAALQGQHVVIATLSIASLLSQIKLIDAAIAAGVQRFIPSDFGANMEVPSVRALPVFEYKVQVADYLADKAKSGLITYTNVTNNAFLDWGLEHQFLFRYEDFQPLMYDGGHYIFSVTTLSSVGDAVVGVLAHLDETANRTVYVEDIKISQQQILKIAQLVAPKKLWAPKHVSIEDTVKISDARLAQGLYDDETFAPYLYKSAMHPSSGCSWEKTDNALLGVKGLTENDLTELVKRYIK